MRRSIRTATGTVTTAPPRKPQPVDLTPEDALGNWPPQQTGLTPEQELANWLITSGTLRKLAEQRAKHRREIRKSPWQNGGMVIQRFGLPSNVVTAYQEHGRRLITSQVAWQGGQLALEGACQVLLSEIEMDRLFAEYCSTIT